jgi:hypothetical protein
VQPDPEADPATAFGGAFAHIVKNLLKLMGRLAPGQVDIDMFGRDLPRDVGGAAEIDGRIAPPTNARPSETPI